MSELWPLIYRPSAHWDKSQGKKLVFLFLSFPLSSTSTNRTLESGEPLKTSSDQHLTSTERKAIKTQRSSGWVSSTELADARARTLGPFYDSKSRAVATKPPWWTGEDSDPLCGGQKYSFLPSSEESTGHGTGALGSVWRLPVCRRGRVLPIPPPLLHLLLWK